MPKLVAWSVDAQNPQPQKIQSSHIHLEKHLEDWITDDVTLIADGLTIVGRQLTIDDGRLDLLAIDFRDRWVVIEIKPDMLTHSALSQALYYASSLAQIDADELKKRIEPNLHKFGDAETLSARVNQLLAREDGTREIAVLLVGSGIHSGLTRLDSFLGRFNVPISVVSFEVFELDEGPQLLVREAIEESHDDGWATHQPIYTVEAIHRMAVDMGVSEQFSRFISMSEKAGLEVQPRKASVTIAPPADRRRYLMWIRPGPSRGKLKLQISSDAFTEFYPHVSDEQANGAVGRFKDGVILDGHAFDEELREIERFLIEKLPQPKA